MGLNLLQKTPILIVKSLIININFKISMEVNLCHRLEKQTNSHVTFSSEPRTGPWRTPDLILRLYFIDYKTGGKKILIFLLVSTQSHIIITRTHKQLSSTFNPFVLPAVAFCPTSPPTACSCVLLDRKKMILTTKMFLWIQDTENIVISLLAKFKLNKDCEYKLIQLATRHSSSYKQTYPFWNYYQS